MSDKFKSKVYLVSKWAIIALVLWSSVAMNEPAYNLPVHGSRGVVEAPEEIDLNYKPSATMRALQERPKLHRLPLFS